MDWANRKSPGEGRAHTRCPRKGRIRGGWTVSPDALQCHGPSPPTVLLNALGRFSGGS